MTESAVGGGVAVDGGHPPAPAAVSPGLPAPGLLIAALASIGAGAVHAAAAGAHREHPVLARVFVVCATAQIVAGAIALLRPRRRSVAAAVLVVNAAAVVGWALTRVTGIGWIDGLQAREAPQFADGVCATLGAVAVAGAAVALVVGIEQHVAHRPSRLSLLPALAVGALALPAMMVGGTQAHAHHESAAAIQDTAVVVDGAADTSQPRVHVHVHDGPTVSAPAATNGVPPGAPATVAEHPSYVPDLAYDPTRPIDLGGVAGVTPQQQAAAENLVAINVVRLPQWADYRTAEAAGFHSIGDAATGYEHFINWAWIDDDVILDPDHPESLVYVPQSDGSKKLVSAMYMLPDTVALTDVPDIGGALMQWHIHDNLCFTSDPVAPVVAGITHPDGSCRSGLTQLRPAPMIHVWIVPNACGPFAALEGIGAGQIADGDTRLCDHIHGDGLL